jgi:hypothetical protein
MGRRHTIRHRRAALALAIPHDSVARINLEAAMGTLSITRKGQITIPKFLLRLDLPACVTP